MKTNGNDAIHNSEQGTQDGLTKREYFAALAMQGILANASGIAEPEHWCDFAVIYADALIAELNKDKGEVG